jgi:hypothetical protein
MKVFKYLVNMVLYPFYALAVAILLIFYFCHSIIYNLRTAKK